MLSLLIGRCENAISVSKKKSKTLLKEIAMGIKETKIKKWLAGIDKKYTRTDTDDCIKIESDEMRLELDFESNGYAFSGSMHFKCEDGWRTTARRGIEQSFYGTIDKREAEDWMQYYSSVVDIIKEQEEVAKAKRKQIASMITVPGIGFLITPERKKADTKKLQAGGSISFHPAGMGTGIELRVRRSRGRHSIPAPASTARFYDVPSLWKTEWDCD
jgi:hypothetical protein